MNNGLKFGLGFTGMSAAEIADLEAKLPAMGRLGTAGNSLEPIMEAAAPHLEALQPLLAEAMPHILALLPLAAQGDGDRQTGVARRQGGNADGADADRVRGREKQVRKFDVSKR